MSSKIDPKKKAANAGISLAPDLKKEATDLALSKGHNSLSGFTAKMLRDAIKRAKQAERDAQEKGEREMRAALRKK